MPCATKLPPVFLMGLTNATYGLCSGFCVVAVPEMLAAQGVSGGRIAAIVAWILSPSVWALVFSPMLDVRFSRRTYALCFSVIAAGCVGFTTLHHGNATVVTSVMILGYGSATLVQGAVGGWMGSLIRKEDDSRLGAWFAIGNTGAGGVMMLLSGEIISRFSPTVAAIALACLLLLPTLIYTVVPAPGPDRRLASESFSQFFSEIFLLLKKREVRIVLLLFLLPAASFALTNVLAGIGGDFHASARFISLFSGVGSILAGIAGSLLVPWIARRMRLQRLYLGIGIVGGIFTLTLLLLPHQPWTFAIAVTGQNLLQAAAFAVENSISFESVGQNNPLAATQFTLLMSASCLPIIYMGFVDGHAYDAHGLVGSFVADAGLSIALCLILLMVLSALNRRGDAFAAIQNVE